MAKRKSAVVKAPKALGTVTADGGLRNPSFPSDSALKSMSMLELIEAGIVPRTPPTLGQRTVATGDLLIETLLGGVTVETDSTFVPSGGDLPVEEVEMQGRGTQTTDGVRTLRRLGGSILLDGIDDGTDMMPVLQRLDQIAALGLPCRLYGPIPYKMLAWRLLAPDWDDDGVWDGNDKLVQTGAALEFVEHNPVRLLTINEGQPGAARDAAEKRGQSFIANPVNSKYLRG